jgi:phage terminase small subunit
VTHEPPTHLEGRAREIWDEHVARIDEWPWIDLRFHDLMLALYCSALATVEEVRPFVEQDPSEEDLAWYDDLERLVYEHAEEMGFTPASQRDIQRAMRERERRRWMEGRGDVA